MIIHNHHVRLSLQLWPRQQWGWSLHGALCAHGERLGFARRGEPRDDAGDPVRDVALVPTRTGLWNVAIPGTTGDFNGNYFWFVPHLPVEGLQIYQSGHWRTLTVSARCQIECHKKRNVEYTFQIGCQNMYMYIYIHIHLFVYQIKCQT